MKPSDNPWGPIQQMPEKDAKTYAKSMDGNEPYTLGPGSLPAPAEYKGKLIHRTWNNSLVYPGTKRDYWIYVPAAYDANQPAALMVFQDGEAYLEEKLGITNVFDNLIASGEMPVTIGLFINSGTPGPGNSWGGNHNRQIEYDALDADYARFLIDEIIPDVANDYSISDNPELRALCGISSGGICAFTVAWQRSDAFRKVVSHCGTFLNVLGGHNYPSMIRHEPKKPLRVFLQTGEKDLDILIGNIELANRQMHAALKYREYDVRFEFGVGGHTLLHGASLFPETMRWLWHGWEKQASVLTTASRSRVTASA